MFTANILKGLSKPFIVGHYLVHAVFFIVVRFVVAIKVVNVDAVFVVFNF